MTLGGTAVSKGGSDYRCLIEEQVTRRLSVS